MPSVIRQKYGAPVTTGSAIIFLYPTGMSANDYRQDGGATFFPRALQNTYVQNVDFTLSYGELQVTLTWLNPITIPYDASRTDSNNSGGQWAIGLQLPLNIDAALVLPKADGNDIYNFT